MSDVSKKKTPASSARSIIARASSSVASPPKFIVPRQSRLTLSPLLPSRVVSIREGYARAANPPHPFVMAGAADAVLFDVDGTLVDSVELHARAWQEALAHFGKHVRLADVRRQIGKGGDQLIPVFLSAHEQSRYGEALDRYRGELWRASYMPKVRPLPGARELVLRAKADGKRVALASSGKKEEVEWNRELLGLDPALLEAATPSDDAERSKPAPDIFEAALAATRVPAERAVAVGDSPWDAL